MEKIKKLGANIRENFAEYWTILILVLAIPTVISFVFVWWAGVLLSLSVQALIGIYYIRGANNG